MGLQAQMSGLRLQVIFSQIRPLVKKDFQCSTVIARARQWRTQKIFMGVRSGSYGGHLYLVCALCDVTIWRHFLFPSQRFGEVCWHNMHTFLHPLPLVYTAMTQKYQRSKLGYRRKTNTTQRHSSS